MSPTRCLKCLAVIEQGGLLCCECWGEVRFIHGNSCLYCGLPKRKLLDSKLCVSCSAIGIRRPITVRSVFVYDDWAASIIAKMKFANGTHIARPLGKMLSMASAKIANNADVIIPIPMHWLDLLFRRYNQSVLLATHLGAIYKLPVLCDVLRKHRMTRHQRLLSKDLRLINLRKAFSITKRSAIIGRNIILVDDIITTGATIREASRALLRAGARSVHVVSLARALPRSYRYENKRFTGKP